LKHAAEITTKAFGESNIFVAKCYKHIKEAYLKNNSSRQAKSLDHALKYAQQSHDILEKLLGEKANYFLAKSLLSFGEVYLEKK
jgi:hypothetical protein